MFSQNDRLYMKRALQLAKLAGVESAPNPMVGSVIVHNSKIIGEGYHKKYGEAHAEVNAVNAVKDMSLLRSSTIYVTLEPCAHHGKTPPCSDLIVQHQFKRVVVACKDTFSEVSGRGIEKMKKAGITVDVGLLEDEARELNKRFFTYHEKKRPYVILKWAQTLDGFMDRLPEERSKGINWITTPIMKTFVHRWRSKEQAIMVGWKTIANDNPSLTVREVEGASPHRFIIDPECQTPVDAKVLNDNKSTTIIVKKNIFKKLPDSVEIVSIEKYSTKEILKVIYNRNMLSVFIEGGAHTLQKFINDDLWDEARVIEGPVTFGKGLNSPVIQGALERGLEEIEENNIIYFRNS